ncbi:Probable multidrug resistance ABC transporter ATP-binding/permease protein YheH [Arcanobacterium haemolyticum]|uniref:ABC transporter ATP-binding protein n=1 Tax=Arcanobacterium haemolyticum TaxID=28264 RepID=UPI000D97D6C2|nr:ABC transporter ATP-binding protein [Arcanobacterium haemolyticum]SPT75286.1 Probable multidrug resistance ABC transporter ATP-binding/permease protein YheH [Arcanobacterium haemolyticum]
MKLPIASNATIMRQLGALVAKFRSELIFVLVVQLMVALATVVTPWVIGASLDAVNQGVAGSVIRTNVIILIVAVIVQSLTAGYGEYVSRVLGQKVFNDLRVELVKSVTHLPLSTVESAGTGDLLGRTTTDVDRIEFIVRVGISRIMMLSMQVAVTVIAALLVDWRIGFVVALSFVPVFFVVRKYLRRTIAAYLASSALYAEVSGDIAETVEHSETIDSLAMGEHRVRRTMTLMAEHWENERYSATMRAIFGAGMVIVLFSPVIIAVLWGAWLIGLGYVSVGAVTAVALYAQQLRGPIDELSWWIDEMQFAAVALARIFGVAQVPPDRVAGEDLPIGDAIDVRGVSFSYRDGVTVLDDVDLSVAPGERVAIVGPSGAGKSTLGRLIAGVNAPTSGSLTIGGVEVTKIEEKYLHSSVALVTQENHVFVGTIADNLRFASPQARDVRLWDALDIVDATWVRDLPDGLETKVGSGHRDLAPAQAQQLALARIVLLDPDVVILDEATSLLDPTVARSAELALGRVLEGRTVISIAHRLYTAYDADRVCVMIDGRVAELGSHDELVALGGQYASLWNTWQQD